MYGKAKNVFSGITIPLFDKNERVVSISKVVLFSVLSGHKNRE